MNTSEDIILGTKTISYSFTREELIEILREEAVKNGAMPQTGARFHLTGLDRRNGKQGYDDAKLFLMEETKI